MPDYFVHNVSRSRFNRSQRMLAPSHSGLQQHIGGEHRVRRGRPTAMSEANLLRHLKELKEKKKLGLIDVKDAQGRSIDLETGEPQGKTLAMVPLPNPPPDSIQRDKPAGIFKPQMAGGFSEQTAPGAEGPQLPDLVSAAPSEHEDEEEDEHGEEESGEEHLTDDVGNPIDAEGNPVTPEQPGAHTSPMGHGKGKKNKKNKKG